MEQDRIGGIRAWLAPPLTWAALAGLYALDPDWSWWQWALAALFVFLSCIRIWRLLR